MQVGVVSTAAAPGELQELIFGGEEAGWLRLHERMVRGNGVDVKEVEIRIGGAKGSILQHVKCVDKLRQ